MVIGRFINHEMTKRIGLAVGLAVTAAAASAQSMNLDFGDPSAGPPASYAAAGQAGQWNALPAVHGTSAGNLVDLAGAVTAATVTQIGGLELLVLNDPLVQGDDAALLDDYLITYNAGLESCIFLDGMQPGLYQVTVYARMPDSTIGSYTSVDQEPGFPHLIVGGVWPGSHAPLVSYSGTWQG